MVGTNAQNWKASTEQDINIGNTQARPSLVGITSDISGHFGNDKISTGGEDSQLRDSPCLREQSNYGIGGKLVRQLIASVEQQLAYHQSQVKELEAKLQELQLLTEHIENE